MFQYLVCYLKSTLNGKIFIPSGMDGLFNSDAQSHSDWAHDKQDRGSCIGFILVEIVYQYY